MIKKWKFPRFCRFPGSEWESATLSPNFHFFFICNFIFFSFSFVFDGFPLFFMVFLDFRCHGQGKWKKNEKNEKNMIKQWKFPRVFEDFLVRSENLQLWVQIFTFFSFATSFFFIFLCFWWFSIVFHCFSWFSWISGATGKENEKKMKFKMKKHEVWNEKKMMFEIKKHEVWRNKKRKKNEK